MKIEKSILEIIFPKDTFKYFDLTKGHSDKDNIYITLEEKHIPPVIEELKDKKIKAKKFHDITITDFPIRGRRTLLTFRLRYWQVEGREEYLKKDIKMNFPGTQLEEEFARFLKEDGERGTLLAGHYRKVSAPPDEGI